MAHSKPASLMSRRYRAMAQVLSVVEGSLRKAADRLGVPHTSFSEYARGAKNAETRDVERAAEVLGIDWAFFTDPALGADPDYRDFPAARVELDVDAGESRARVRELVRRWVAKKAPGVVRPEHLEQLYARFPHDLSERTLESWWQDLVDREERGEPPVVAPPAVRHGARRLADIDAERGKPRPRKR